MIRRLPVLPTLLVLVAVGVMIALGLWQLDRRGQKQEMLARYEAAAASAEPVRWPGEAGDISNSHYRRSSVTCGEVTARSTTAGRSAQGEAGLAQIADCVTAEGDTVRVVLGWSRDPEIRDWHGGKVEGTIAPGPRLIADPPLAGLAANAAPDPSDIPNNHLAYAVQWFFFAATALVIYWLALRKRWRG